MVENVPVFSAQSLCQTAFLPCSLSLDLGEEEAGHHHVFCARTELYKFTELQDCQCMAKGYLACMLGYHQVHQECCKDPNRVNFLSS